MSNFSLKETPKDHIMALVAAVLPTLILFWGMDSLTLRDDWMMAAIMALTLHLAARLGILHFKVQRHRAEIESRKNKSAQEHRLS